MATIAAGRPSSLNAVEPRGQHPALPRIVCVIGAIEIVGVATADEDAAVREQRDLP